jgi:hypothetical protein
MHYPCQNISDRDFAGALVHGTAIVNLYNHTQPDANVHANTGRNGDANHHAHIDRSMGQLSGSEPEIGDRDPA